MRCNAFFIFNLHCSVHRYLKILSVNKEHVLTDFVYVVRLDISLKPKQGSQVLIQHGGGTELATLRGKSLITEDGEVIEGEALDDDITVIGVVTFTLYAMFVLIILLLFNWGIYGAGSISQ